VVGTACERHLQPRDQWLAVEVMFANTATFVRRHTFDDRLGIIIAFSHCTCHDYCARMIVSCTLTIFLRQHSGNAEIHETTKPDLEGTG
jgi:hypothetical protein